MTTRMLPLLMRTLPLLGALAVGVVGGCSSQATPEAQMPPPAVSAAEVLVKDVAQWDEFTGRVEAVETVELRPRVGGYVERVNYGEGQEVAEGEVLFVIDQRTYRAELARAEAELARASSGAQLARSEAARAQRLVEVKAISREEFDQRNAATAQADAGVRAAQAAVQMARLNLESTEVRAPIAGRAGRALVTAGNLVNAAPNATLLTTIVSLDPVHVYFEGDEQTYLRHNAMARSGERSSARDVRSPVRVGLSTDSDFPYEGVVDFVDNQLDANTGTIRSRAVLSNSDRVFTPGMFARVRLLGDNRLRALLIDDKAVLTDQDRKYVYVLSEDGLALRKDVVLGRMLDGLRVVQSGLEAGDRVIVHGVQKVFFPGMPVQAQQIAMGEPPAPAGAPPQAQ